MRHLTRLWPVLALMGGLGLPAAHAFEALPSAGPTVMRAQYDGPGFDGPPGYGPGGMPGYGPGGGMGYGPGGMPGYGPGGGMGGYRLRGRRDEERGPHRYLAYHGFRIDVGGVQGQVDVGSAVQAVEQQIDMVDQAGLSPSMRALFRSVPIRITAGFVEGSHYRGGSEVVLGAVPIGDARPILLHEYMHVYNIKRLPGGFRNATIRAFYEEARARGLYKPDAFLMSNPAEFFAVTASCYLHGTIAREPFTREAIRERQPDYYAYLAHLFGRGGVASTTIKGRPARVAGLH